MTKAPVRAWAYWLLAAMFFFSHYLIRVAPSGLTETLMMEFGVTAVALGMLGTAFYIGYMLMQLPSGALIDRFGEKRVIVTALFSAAAATYLFATTDSFTLLIVARALIGVVSAFAFIGAIKLATNWFPAVYLGLIVGLTQGMGMIGGAVGKGPMLRLYDMFDWHLVILYLALGFTLLGTLILIFVKNHPEDATKVSDDLEESFNAPYWRQVLCSKQTWWNALYAGAIFAPILVIGEMWGDIFLQQVHGLTLIQAGDAGAWLFAGWTVGGILAGKLADRYGRRPIMLVSAVITGVQLAALLYLPLPVFAVQLLMISLGFCNGGLIASYTVSGEMHPNYATGLSVALCNLASVIIGALMQWAVGASIDVLWDGTMVNGIPYYDGALFQKSMASFPIMSLVAFVAALFVKETLRDEPKA